MEARSTLPKWLTAMLVLLHEAWSARRDAHVRFLKLQVGMLKERLPCNRVILSPAERRRLMEAGAEVDHGIQHTLGIVTLEASSTTSLRRMACTTTSSGRIKAWAIAPWR